MSNCCMFCNCPLFSNWRYIVEIQHQPKRRWENTGLQVCIDCGDDPNTPLLKMKLWKLDEYLIFNEHFSELYYGNKT